MTTGTSTDWAAQKTINLETRKRDGSWVATPVSLAHVGNRLFFRTYSSSGKAKRLRNFPEVRVTPCTFLGKPTGSVVAGSARRVHGAEEQRARAALREQHPFLQGVAVPNAHRALKYRTLHYELTLAAD